MSERLPRVRRIEPRDAETLRALRLRALETDPLSFGSTWERESAWTVEWDDWAREDGHGTPCATFFALADDGEAVGLAAGYREEDPWLFVLIAMWIAPEHRRCGHARRLVEAVAAWAAASGGRELQLWVTNRRARALYEDSGFEPDGREQPLPHAPHVVETGMTRPLRR